MRLSHRIRFIVLRCECTIVKIPRESDGRNVSRYLVHRLDDKTDGRLEWCTTYERLAYVARMGPAVPRIAHRAAVTPLTR